MFMPCELDSGLDCGRCAYGDENWSCLWKRRMIQTGMIIFLNEEPHVVVWCNDQQLTALPVYGIKREECIYSFQEFDSSVVLDMEGYTYVLEF